MDVNLNTAQCLVHKADFLSTTIYNICTGTEEVVQHGTADLAAGALMLFVLLGFVALFTSIIIMIIRG